MKKLLVITATLMIGLFAHAFAASYNVGVNLDARVGGYIVGGGTSFNQFTSTLVTNPDGTTSLTNVNTPGQSIGVEANDIDDSEITFTASVDNVSASVTFERQAADNAVIQFDSANLTVSDIFGMVTLRFFDWGYSAGSSANEGNYILSDIGFQGFYITIKPIDLISVGLGFGVNSDSVRGLRVDTSIGGPVPTSIYIGLVINSIDNLGGIVEEGTIERFQVGFESALYGSYLNLGFGILPLGSTLKYYKVTSVDRATAEYTTEADPTVDGLSFAVSLSGSASFLGGFIGIGYGVQFVNDTIAKVFAAGRGQFGSGKDIIFPGNHSYQALQGDGGDLWETLAVNINPSLNLGQFTLGFDLKYEYFGTTYSGYELRDKALHAIGLDPYVKWVPAEGFFVKGTLGFDFLSETTATIVEELGDYTLLSTGSASSVGANLPLALEDIFAELQIGVNFGVSSE